MLAGMDEIRVCVAGATGWTGAAVARAILADPEFELVGAVARRAAGQDLGATLGIGAVGLLISPTVDAALRVGCDVLVDYTSHAAVQSHIDLAVGRRGACAVCSAGLTGADCEAIADR